LSSNAFRIAAIRRIIRRRRRHIAVSCARRAAPAVRRFNPNIAIMKIRPVASARVPSGSKDVMGLREQNKLEKRQRIRAAAADLFKRRGYTAATMRQIALKAHVGIGTLFNYAEDKRDLVFLIFNDELAALTAAALREPQPDDTLAEQVIAVFRIHYRYFARNPVLSRILLQELTFYSTGKQAKAFLQIRKGLIDGVEQLVQTAQRRRRILSAEPAAFIARHFFFVYSAAVRSWIVSARPDPEVGLADLKRLLDLQIKGLSPAIQAKRPPRR
jgi:AcrR family transcriptional regulator